MTSKKITFSEFTARNRSKEASEAFRRAVELSVKDQQELVRKAAKLSK